jgi:DNA-binding IscR family transcriptional regulator
MLRAEKGVKGGVKLAMPAEAITLLAVVEACHGPIVGEYCNSPQPESSVCNFHRAALELHRAITGVLGHWTVADLLEHPHARPELACFMARGRHVATPFPMVMRAGEEP